jgi:hypothetical protein
MGFRAFSGKVASGFPSENAAMQKFWGGFYFGKPP